ncbi:MAG: TOMM precursor leader peptide-binding protein [Caldilineaceae bacterium]|nr:TOMM precursor leader peptide-binding protein [Caldilineaceae bacterium]
MANLNSNTTLSIAEGLDVVVISNDEVLIQFGARSRPSELLRDSDLNGFLGKVMTRLVDGPQQFEQLCQDLSAAARAEVKELIEDLLARGIVTEAGKSPVEQYLRYTLTGEATLAERSVSLIGAGPIGARVAHSLLQQGIGQLNLLDDRKATDVWRAFLPLLPDAHDSHDDPVHVLLQDRLHDAGYVGASVLNGQLDSEGLEEAVTRADFIVAAFEQPSLQLTSLLNRYCIRQRKPWLLLTIDGNLGLIGPLFVPVHTCCYNDFRTLFDAGTPSSAMARKHRQHRLQRATGSFFPGLPPYAEIVAGYGALAAVDYMLRDSCFALGRVMVIDFERMMIDVEDVLKLPRCPVCGSEKSAYSSPFSAGIVQ